PHRRPADRGRPGRPGRPGRARRPGRGAGAGTAGRARETGAGARTRAAPPAGCPERGEAVSGYTGEFVHRRRRGAELVLLVLALGVGIGAYAAVGLGVEEKVPADLVGYSAWLAALALGAHVVVRLTAPYADPVLLPVVTALNG